MAANTKELSRRIKSIGSTLQITKALELISSIKMRHAISSAEASRQFSQETWRLIAAIKNSSSQEAGTSKPILFTECASTKKQLLIVIAGDKGLAGSYNANILRQALKYTKEQPDDALFDVVTVGKRAAKIQQLIPHSQIVSDFPNPSETMDFFQASPISKIAIDSYLNDQYHKVAIIHTDFVNTLKQVATAKTILPITDAAIGQELREEDAESSNQASQEFKFEPDRHRLLEILSRLAVRSQIYQALLEASASEHAARMVAMKNATENGKELVDDLKFTYNQLRQQGITNELIEISAGAAAIN